MNTQRIRNSEPVIQNVALDTSSLELSTWPARLRSSRSRSLASYGSPSPSRSSLAEVAMIILNPNVENQTEAEVELEPMDVVDVEVDIDVENGESRTYENHENSIITKNPGDDDSPKENRHPKDISSKRNDSKVFQTRFNLRSRPLRIPYTNIDNANTVVSPVSMVGVFVHSRSASPGVPGRNLRNGVKNCTSCYRLSEMVTNSSDDHIESDSNDVYSTSSSNTDTQSNDCSDSDSDSMKFAGDEELPCCCPPQSPKMTWDMVKDVHELTKDKEQLDVISFSPLVKIPVTLMELNHLRPNEWISDRIVDFYLQLIQQRSQNNDNCLKVYSFETTFYPLLSGDKGLDETAETTDGVDLFKFDLAFIPVCVSDHWRLVAVDFTNCIMKVLNSKTSFSDCKILVNISKFIDAEHLRKYNYPDSRDWIRSMDGANVPQQKNNDDCGIFSLQYAEYLSRKVDLDFNQDHITYFRYRIMNEIAFGRLLTEL